MMPAETDFYHDALDVLPSDVVELARFLRDLSVSREWHDEILDDPLDKRGWQQVADEVPDYGPEGQQCGYRDATIRVLNWFGLARQCPIPGMPVWRWRDMVAEVKALWESKHVEEDPDDPFAEQEFDWTTEQRGEVVAKLLLEQCAEFVRTFLLEPRPIPLRRAEELTPRQWEAVVLVCNQRLDAPEAAAILGIETSTLRKYLEEAAKALDMSVKEMRRRRIDLPR